MRGGREYNFCLKSKSLSCIIQAMREGASNGGRKVGDASAMIDRTSMLWQPLALLYVHMQLCVCACVGVWVGGFQGQKFGSTFKPKRLSKYV